MKKLLSTKYSASAFNIAMVILRLGSGILMMNHGYDKLVHFSSYQNKFMNFFGIGTSFSLTLAIFAEFFCSLFIILGLFTRFAVIPLIIVMCVALFKAHNAAFFGKGELPALYLTCFLLLLLLGPGRASIDSMMGK